MELLIAFLIAFGVISDRESEKVTEDHANKLVQKYELEKDYIIWGLEADDF